MKTRVLIFLFLLFPVLSYSQTMQSVRADYISFCEDQGDEYGLCACTFDAWAQTISANGGAQAVAMSVIGMITESSMPTMDQMQQIQPYMASFSQAGMQCAMGNLEGIDGMEGIEELQGMDSIYSGNGDSYGSQTADQIAESVSENTDSGFGSAFGRLLSGDTSALGDIANYDSQARANQQQQRDQAAADEAEQYAAIEADKNRLRELHSDELATIENGSILNRSFNSFQSLHTLYCQIENRHKQGYSAACDCSWQQLGQVAQSDPTSANLTAYITSRNEGDLAREDGLAQEVFDQAIANSQTFYDRRYEVCFSDD